MSDLAPRKWLIRRERHKFDGDVWFGGWIVTAPSGNRRWFANWPMLQALCPFFAMGEAAPYLRDETPEVFDGGVRI